MLMLDLSPYSTEIVPCDLFHFPKAKRAFKENQFQFVKEVEAKTAELLKR